MKTYKGVVKLSSPKLTRKLHTAFNDSFTLLILLLLLLLLLKQRLYRKPSMKLRQWNYEDICIWTKDDNIFSRILKYFVLDFYFHFWCICCSNGFCAICSQSISVTCLNFTRSGFSVIVIIKSWTTSNELSTTSSFCSIFSNLFVVTIRLKSQTRLMLYSFLFN